MENELFIKRITLKANLEKLAGKINAAQWDEGNALPDGEYLPLTLLSGICAVRKFLLSSVL